MIRRLTLRELKDRVYFFVPTRMSLGILIAYRDNVGEATVGMDVEEIYKLRAQDADALARALEDQQPFAKLFECQRGNGRTAVIFTRAFADRTAMYCAIELEASYRDLLAVTVRLGFGESVIEYLDAELKDDLDGVEPDPKLFKYLNTVYSSNAKQTVTQRQWPDSPVDVADEIMAICEFLGVQLELDLTMDIWDHTESRFSFKRCAEIVAVFGCVARRYTVRRVLGVELCRCFDNFRIKILLDFDSSKSEAEACAVIGEFSRIMDVAISSERGESFTYEAIPRELELEVAGVKEEF